MICCNEKCEEEYETAQQNYEVVDGFLSTNDEFYGMIVFRCNKCGKRYRLVKLLIK